MGRHGERVRLGDQLILVRDGPDAARSTEFCTRILVAHRNQNSSWPAIRSCIDGSELSHQPRFGSMQSLRGKVSFSSRAISVTWRGHLAVAESNPFGGGLFLMDLPNLNSNTSFQ